MQSALDRKSFIPLALVSLILSPVSILENKNERSKNVKIKNLDYLPVTLLNGLSLAEL